MLRQFRKKNQHNGRHTKGIKGPQAALQAGLLREGILVQLLRCEPIHGEEPQGSYKAAETDMNGQKEGVGTKE